MDRALDTEPMFPPGVPGKLLTSESSGEHAAAYALSPRPVPVAYKSEPPPRMLVDIPTMPMRPPRRAAQARAAVAEVAPTGIHKDRALATLLGIGLVAAGWLGWLLAHAR